MVARGGNGSPLEQAKALADGWRLGQALAVVDGLAGPVPARGDVARVKARILVDLGRFVDAADLLDRLGLLMVEGDEELAVLRGRTMTGIGTAAGAELASQALVRRFPNSWRAWLLRADVLAELGSSGEARDAVLRAARFDGRELDVAVTALQVEAIDVSARVLREHQRVAPDAAGHFVEAMLVLYRDHDLAAADAALQAGRRRDGDHPMGYAVEAALFIAQADPERALRAADQLLAASDALSARILRATVYLSERRLDEALTDVEAVLAQQPSSPEALLLRASLLAARADWTGVVRDASQALDRLPGSVEARLLRGRAQLEVGQPGLARRDAMTVLDAEPQNGDALLLRARTSFAQGGYAQAVQEVDEAISVQGETPDNLLLRVRALLRVGGRHAEAVRDVRSILRIDPSHELARELLRVEERVRADARATIARGVGRFLRGLTSG